MEEGSLVAEFKEETAPGVALAHAGPRVGYDVTGVVSHLGGGAALPAEEASNRTVTVQDSREDGTVANCVERIRYIHGNNGIFLAVCEIRAPSPHNFLVHNTFSVFTHNYFQ